MGERVIVYETTEEGWAWGQIETDGYVGWMSANALARARRRADPQGRRACARSAFPGPTSSCRPRRRCRWARCWRSPATGRALRRHRVGLAYSGGASGVDARRRKSGLRRRRRVIPRHALSVGRQDLARHRLLGPGAGRACRPPASPARATATCRNMALGRPSSIAESAPRRSGVLEGPRRHRARLETAAARQRAPHGRGDRAGRGRDRAHQGDAGSDVTSVKRL